MLKVLLTFYGGRDFTFYFCVADSKPKYDTRCANRKFNPTHPFENALEKIKYF